MAMILLAIASTLIAIDLYIDFVEGVGIIHLLAEMFVFGVAIAGIVVLWRQLKQTRSDLAGALVEAEHWKNESRELIKGLGVAIEHQFERWKLSKAESEVGLLLLKGLSHKEIASLRETSERTVREQARSLYRKAGLAGRSSLAAFFLEDLLLPHGETGN
ncbi:MAG: LuxR C-terminal-related transcriptional regulator [Woeseiaceae bacterium]